MKSNLHFRAVRRGIVGWTFGLALALPLAAATLTNGTVHPQNGDLATVFKFSVTYLNPASSTLPQAVDLILDESTTNAMSAADPADLNPRDGKLYVWSGTLPKARHRFRFATTPASTSDILRHAGPDVSDAPLLVRPFFFFLHCPADYLAGDFLTDLTQSRLAWVGDLNGDGYADLAHAWCDAPIHGHANEGTVTLYYGPDFARSEYLLHPRYPVHEMFGASVAGGGDLDGDGLDDLVVGSAGAHPQLFVYQGRVSGPPALANEISTANVETAEAILDVNGDGSADIASLESVLVVWPPTYATTRLKVRLGPGLAAGISSDLGAGANQTFKGQLSITDRNKDGLPDFVFHGSLDSYEWYSPGAHWIVSEGIVQFKSYDGPDLSLHMLPSSPPIFKMTGVGDLDGDGAGDFGRYGLGVAELQWYAGPDATLRGAVALPSGPGNEIKGFFGAGDGTGTGRDGLVMVQENVSDEAQCGLHYYSGTATNPFASHRFLSEPLIGKRGGPGIWGLAHDTDGNGLDDFYVSGIGSSDAPLGDLAASTLGFVLVGSPCYPYPLSEGDLPARFRARMAGCRIDLGDAGFYALSPNGSIEFAAGTADADHRAPLIILADSLQVPDKLIGETDSGNPIILRVRAAGENGSGYIYADGPLKGQGKLQLRLTVEFVELRPAERVVLTDTLLAKVDLDPPLDLATGYGKLVCRGAMTELLAAARMPSVIATLTMAGYVEYVRPVASPFLMGVPTRADFGGVCVGSNSPPQRITLCNLGETALHITGLTLPGAPFQIIGSPALPATVNPASALVLTAQYQPTSPGHHEAAITVNSDDPAHPTATVLLSGSAIAPGEQDTDGDGLPDSFEKRCASPTDPQFSGLSTNLLDAHLDNDRDGTSNQNEYFAGTDPTDAESVFKLVAAQRLSATSLQLNWLSVTGKTYAICRSTNLLSGYTPIQTDLAGNGKTNTFTITAPSGSSGFFYRIRVD